MDYALVNLGVTVALLVATFAFRKRILSALGRLLLRGTIEFARGAFLTEDVSEAEDGTKVARIGLSAQGRAIIGAVTPVLIAEVAKNVKFNIPDLMKNMPQVGAQELGSALMGGVAQRVVSGKKLRGDDILQGIVGYILPRAESLLGTFTGAPSPTAAVKKPEMSEITKKLIP